MEGCSSTSSSRPGKDRILQHLFLGTQEGRWTQAHLELEVLQLQCSQHSVQDGDLAIHYCNHTAHQWMANVDLKGTYFHIKVEASHHRFIRFQWLGKSCQFRTLPFRLSSASRVFTKTLVPLIAWLRLLGVQLYSYLDDLFIIWDSPLGRPFSGKGHSGPHLSRVRSEPEEGRSQPHTRSCVNRGQVLYCLGQTVSTKVKDSGSHRLRTILLQGRGCTSQLTCS